MNKILLIVLALSILSFSACGFQTVDQGNTGVKKTLGKVSDEALPPGFYTYNPFLSGIIEMDNHTQKWEDEANVYTKDVQQANIKFAINYNLKASSSILMYSTIGQEWAEVLIPQVVNGNIKNVIGTWDAIELVANRAKASSVIEEAIGKALAKYGVEITGFQLTNIKFQDLFEKAVEDKQVAVQKAEQARNETVQVQETANQTVISAKADAEAMQIKSAALSQNQNLVAYEAVQKWNGVLPTYVMGGNGGTIMNIPFQSK